MAVARCAPGCAANVKTGKLFACGGYGGNRIYLDCAEYLDLQSCEQGWSMLPRMSCRRAGPNAAVVRELQRRVG